MTEITQHFFHRVGIKTLKKVNFDQFYFLFSTECIEAEQTFPWGKIIKLGNAELIFCRGLLL